MDSENMKGKIALTVIGAATLLAALAGATFAYFSATSTTATREITTANLNLKVAIDGEAAKIENIKPTKWTSATAAASNADIAVIPFTVSGDSSTNGAYTINMQTSVTLNDGTVVEQQPADGDEAVQVPLKGGEISDIKYRLFDSTGAELITETAFDADENGAINVDIITNGTITANETLDDSYTLYVYIKDSDGDQNKLQDIDFTITLGGSASQA